MTDLKTSDSKMQFAVDISNALMERSHRYRISRHRDQPNPDFSNVRWYLGMKQRYAIGYCATAIRATVMSPNYSEFMGFPVTWVEEEDHASLVEVKA